MLLIVAHDAGGAELLSSYVRRCQLKCIYHLEGPALKIFEKKLGPITNVPLIDAIVMCDWVLCGTGWQTDLEWSAIKYAKKFNKKAVAFLDHWVNYRERFLRQGFYLPDEIWVADEFALQLARRVFGDLPMRLVDNPYLEDIREAFSTIAQKGRITSPIKQVLYVCEPIDAQVAGYNETMALRYFIENISALGSDISRIVLRPHPSEQASKYSWIIKESAIPITINANRSLIEEINESDIVVGCETMAMVVALVAKKRVICCIPPGGKACSLPFLEIESLALMVSAALPTSSDSGKNLYE